MASNNCPCGLEQTYSQCCEPFIKGSKKAATAEQLLRARYTAFVKGAVDYVISTHHSKTVGQIKREEVAEWSAGSEWLGLEIVNQDKGQASDEEGAIIFHAYYNDKKKPEKDPETGEILKLDHFERSVFKKEDGQWKFFDAQAVHSGPIRREGPKVGRNDPCPCGSGKKVKKCCAA
jgi:SEC-C motif-containing protein